MSVTFVSHSIIHGLMIIPMNCCLKNAIELGCSITEYIESIITASLEDEESIQIES